MNRHKRKKIENENKLVSLRGGFTKKIKLSFDFDGTLNYHSKIYRRWMPIILFNQEQGGEVCITTSRMVSHTVPYFCNNGEGQLITTIVNSLQSYGVMLSDILTFYGPVVSTATTNLLQIEQKLLLWDKAIQEKTHGREKFGNVYYKNEKAFSYLFAKLETMTDSDKFEALLNKIEIDDFKGVSGSVLNYLIPNIDFDKASLPVAKWLDAFFSIIIGDALLKKMITKIQHDDFIENKEEVKKIILYYGTLIKEVNKFQPSEQYDASENSHKERQIQQRIAEIEKRNTAGEFKWSLVHIDDLMNVHEKMCATYASGNKMAPVHFDDGNPSAAVHSLVKLIPGMQDAIDQVVVNGFTKGKTFSANAAIFLYLIQHAGLDQENKLCSLKKDFNALYRKDFFKTVLFKTVCIEYSLRNKVVKKQSERPEVNYMVDFLRYHYALDRFAQTEKTINKLLCLHDHSYLKMTLDAQKAKCVLLRLQQLLTLLQDEVQSKNTVVTQTEKQHDASPSVSKSLPNHMLYCEESLSATSLDDIADLIADDLSYLNGLFVGRNTYAGEGVGLFGKSFWDLLVLFGKRAKHIVSVIEVESPHHEKLKTIYNCFINLNVLDNEALNTFILDDGWYEKENTPTPDDAAEVLMKLGGNNQFTLFSSANDTSSAPSEMGSPALK